MLNLNLLYQFVPKKTSLEERQSSTCCFFKKCITLRVVMDYSYKKQALKTFWVGVDKYFKIYPVFSAPGTHLDCDTFSPWRVFLIYTPQHQVGNSRLASHCSCQFLVFKTPSPRNFQLSCVGWVWMFSRTANCRQKVLN